LKEKEKVLKHSLRNGYVVVNLSNGNGSKTFYLHRLLAIAYIPNPENKPQINHKNGIRIDFRLENLEWATQSENMQHSHKVLKNKGSMTNKFGKDHNRSKSIKQYDLEGNFIKEFGSTYEAMRETGVLQQNIGKVALNKRNSAGGFIWKY